VNKEPSHYVMSFGGKKNREPYFLTYPRSNTIQLRDCSDTKELLHIYDYSDTIVELLQLRECSNTIQLLQLRDCSDTIQFLHICDYSDTI
jgi:hypothetical protein